MTAKALMQYETGMISEEIMPVFPCFYSSSPPRNTRLPV